MKKEPKILTKCNSIRDIWGKENENFTPWLSKHLAALGNVLDMTLCLQNTEVHIGTKRCDIVATQGCDENKVVIENKFDGIDHKHIGQGITYLTNADAKIAIWVCDSFSKEHLECIAKLNDITNDSYSFYAVSVLPYQDDEKNAYCTFVVEAKPDLSARLNKSQTMSRYSNAWQELSKLVDTNIFNVKVHGRSYNDFHLPIDDMKLGTSLSKGTQNVYFWTANSELATSFGEYIAKNNLSKTFKEGHGTKNPNYKMWVVTRPESSKESFDMQWTADQLKDAYEIAKEYCHQNN